MYQSSLSIYLGNVIHSKLLLALILLGYAFVTLAFIEVICIIYMNILKRKLCSNEFTQGIHKVIFTYCFTERG